MIDKRDWRWTTCLRLHLWHSILRNGLGGQLNKSGRLLLLKYDLLLLLLYGGDACKERRNIDTAGQA